MSLLNLKHDLRTYLSVRTWSLPLFGLRPSSRELVILKDTEIVIEGYPRCANTFTVVAFCQSQARKVKVAHHLHASAQILLAQRLGLPAILLIRDPVDAIVSLIIRHPDLDVDRCLRDYLVFYGSLEHMSSYPVVAEIDDVTNNLGGVIREVNRKFSTTFNEFDNAQESVDAVFAEIESIRRKANRSLSQIATPNAEKNSKKSNVRAEVMRNIDPAKLNKATEIYRHFMSKKTIFDLPD